MDGITYLTTGQLCEELEVPEHYLAALIRARTIAKPPVIVGRRVWSPEAVAEVRRILETRKRGRTGRPPRSALRGAVGPVVEA